MGRGGNGAALGGKLIGAGGKGWGNGGSHFGGGGNQREEGGNGIGEGGRGCFFVKQDGFNRNGAKSWKSKPKDKSYGLVRVYG